MAKLKKFQSIALNFSFTVYNVEGFSLLPDSVYFVVDYFLKNITVLSALTASENLWDVWML